MLDFLRRYAASKGLTISKPKKAVQVEGAKLIFEPQVFDWRTPEIEALAKALYRASHPLIAWVDFLNNTYQDNFRHQARGLIAEERSRFSEHYRNKKG